MSKKVLSGFLDAIRYNATLTSLDFGYNDFKISQKDYLNESLRLFLRDNSGVRQLDLSCNNFDTKTIQAIYLGLLSNDAMLIILLTGNTGALKSKGKKKCSSDVDFIILLFFLDYELVLDKLKQNRCKYKERVESKISFVAFDSDSNLLSELPLDYSPHRPPISPLLSSHLIEEQAVLDSIFQEGEAASASLTVLFSCPLAWRDRTNRLYPIEVLDHNAEREALLQGTLPKFYFLQIFIRSLLSQFFEK